MPPLPLMPSGRQQPTPLLFTAAAAAALLEIFSELRCASGGRPPIVLLSDDVVARPEATLRALCAALAVDFQPAMLSWPAGPKPYDGVWAGHW